MQWELALHALLACIGTWLLARLLLRDELCAGLAAIAYGFSGFFASHASHLNVVQAAAWLPLVLFGVHTSMRRITPRKVILTGLACALLFMIGQFQIAIYAFAAVAATVPGIAEVSKPWRSPRSFLLSLGVHTGLVLDVRRLDLAGCCVLVSPRAR